jgi:hypothetical protein
MAGGKEAVEAKAVKDVGDPKGKDEAIQMETVLPGYADRGGRGLDGD